MHVPSGWILLWFCSCELKLRGGKSDLQYVNYYFTFTGIILCNAELKINERKIKKIKKIFILLRVPYIKIEMTITTQLNLHAMKFKQNE